MPARYLTHPDGSNILAVTRHGRLAGLKHLLLDEAYLSSFGHLRLPQHLDTALQRFDAWIKPALVAEWARLIKDYALRQHRTVDENTLVAALAWSDAARDVGLARGRALQLLQGGGLQCVYSGKRLTANTLDIDHCLPWHAWPCGYFISDLWNLPAPRLVATQPPKERPRTQRSHAARRTNPHPRLVGAGV